MSKCLDEGILQSHLDGELSPQQLQSVTAHVSSCDVCAAAVRRLESDANLLTLALTPELEASVPTERLQRRLDAAIAALERENVRSEQATNAGLFTNFRSFFDRYSFLPQRAFAYSGMLAILIFAVVFAVVRFRSVPADNRVAQTQLAGREARNGNESPLSNQPLNPKPTIPALNSEAIAVKQMKAVHGSRQTQRQFVAINSKVAPVKLLPGERSYLKTIAALDSTLKSSNRTMAPALQAEYQRNLALVDRALATARTAAKRNPNDPDAADFMFTAYQSKVDLLNTVADARLNNSQH